MTEPEIIKKIIETAKAQNISQGELAARAGIRQETLSRAKKNPSLSYKTIEQLAQIVGLKLKLVEDNPIADRIQEGTLFPS